MPINQTSHPIESFETKHMVAKRIAMSDLTDLKVLHQNAQAMDKLGGIITDEENHEYLTRNIQHWNDYGFGLWVFRSINGEFIGRAGVRHVQVIDADEIEVAYALMPQYWGQGLATEMAKASIKIAFEIHKLKNLICLAQTHHQASRHVMEKVGFKYEKELVLFDCPHVLYRKKSSS